MSAKGKRTFDGSKLPLLNLRKEKRSSLNKNRNSNISVDSDDVGQSHVKFSVPPTKKNSASSVISSPYDERQAHRLHKRIFPNRVYPTWYKRYLDQLPESQNLDFQPYDEVQRVDEDIAVQYFYGLDCHLQDPTDRDYADKRKAVLQRYRRVKEQEEKQLAEAQKEDKNLPRATLRLQSAKKNVLAKELEFGATARQMKVYIPILDFLTKLHIGKSRFLRKVNLKPGSKWNVMKNANIQAKLMSMYKRMMQDLIHARFRKVIRLVVAVIRFIKTIRLIAGDTRQILKEIETFKAMQSLDYKRTGMFGMKKLFDPQKYSISKELHLPFEARMTLTKPWFTRDELEINKVIEVLQAYKSFVEYPPLFQRRLATLAWYIETQGDKYIIRERHIACDFYILLKGKAKVVKLCGDPWINGNGHLEFIRYVKKSEGFGDESMSDPECERDYSVISCEPCALLSINVHDYLQMLCTRKEDEFAPEHIIFLSNLKLMENFPKLKLLQEANENITIHYFRPNTLISKDLSESNYILVVMNGTCRLYCEIFPDVVFPDRDSLTLSRRQALKGKESSFIQHLRKPIVAPRKLPLPMIKQHVREQRKMLEPLIAITNDAIKEYQEKIRVMLKTIPKKAQNRLIMESFHQAPAAFTLREKQREQQAKEIIPSTVTVTMDKYYNSIRKTRIFSEDTYSSTQSGFNFTRDSMTSESDTESVTSQPAPAETQVQTTAQSVVAFPSDSLQKVETGSFLDHEEHVPDYLTFASTKSTQFFPSNTTISLEDIQSNDYGFRSNAMSDTTVDDGTQKETLGPSRNMSVPQFHSKWKLVRSYCRGDYTGHEYLDYNDGPYDPPEGVLSLVSDGCEIIMVKKIFLLKYLRKEW